MIELPISVAAPTVSHVDALADGTRLGEFEIRGLIGVGGFGMVYKAYDHSLQRDVAIKEYMPTALAGRADGGLHISVRTSNDHETFHKGLRSFVAEARMLAKFEHPSLVRVFRFWEANDTAYMVMPLYRGMTLKQARQVMRLPPNEAWLRKVLWCILGALKVLHRGTALHRDVSPDNIFLQDSGPPVLLDLGAARLAIGDGAKQHTAILKINYAPIEQYADNEGVPQGPWTDLYALAAVVHGLLCNEAPLPAMIRVVNDKMPPFGNVVKTVASEFGQGYSEQFTQGIAWALHIQPQDRPQSVREFARSLGLVTPNGMSSFDWRAELGPACLPSGNLTASTAEHITVAEQTRPSFTNPDYAPTQFIGTEDESDESASVAANWGPDSTPASQDPKPSERRHRLRETVAASAVNEVQSTARRKKPARSADRRANTTRQLKPAVVWILAASLALLTVVAAAWGWRNWSAKDKLVAPVAVVQPAEEIIPVSTPVAPVLASSEPIETIIESGPAARPASASAVDPKAVKAAERARSAASKPAKVEPLRAPTVAETSSAPAPVVAAASAPEPKPAPPVVTPEKLCSDATFLTRPMCMFRACQRSDLSGTATCVELQKNLQRSKENENSESSRF
jgi:serine/threonine protein kinase